MELSDKTARQIWEDVKANPTRARFGFGTKAVLVNIDVQKAYTTTDEFKTAYETDPNQIQYINELADEVPRARLAGRLDVRLLRRVRRGRRRVGHPHRHPRLAAEHQARLASRGVRRPLRHPADRPDLQQADAVAVLRDAAAVAARVAPGRHRRPHRRLDVGLHPRRRRRLALPRLPHDRPRAVRGRQARELPLREPHRPDAQVRRRRRRRRGQGLPGRGKKEQA